MNLAIENKTFCSSTALESQCQVAIRENAICDTSKLLLAACSFTKGHHRGVVLTWGAFACKENVLTPLV